MDAFDILILVLGIVTGGILFALRLPFYKLLIYFVSIMFLVGMPIAIIFGIAKWIKNYDEEKQSEVDVMCKENCDKCLQDKSCCDGVYYPLFYPCSNCINAAGTCSDYFRDGCEDYWPVDGHQEVDE